MSKILSVWLCHILLVIYALCSVSLIVGVFWFIYMWRNKRLCLWTARRWLCLPLGSQLSRTLTNSFNQKGKSKLTALVTTQIPLLFIEVCYILNHKLTATKFKLANVHLFMNHLCIKCLSNLSNAFIYKHFIKGISMKFSTGETSEAVAAYQLMPMNWHAKTGQTLRCGITWKLPIQFKFGVL